MDIQIRQFVHILIFIIGLGLMVGGIITGKHGAVVVGLIVAAVNLQQWLKWNKHYSSIKKNQPWS
jgi:hypothetical protein